MVHKLDGNDFRAARYVLDPNDFGLSHGEPDPSPTDLIDEAAWREIMDGPDDVAIRTTSHQGSHVAFLHRLVSDWSIAYPREYGIVTEAMLDAGDNYQAATFNLVHGFYKESISSLRSAIETLTIATRCRISDDVKSWDNWHAGGELSFKVECDRLRGLPPFNVQERSAQKMAGTSIFAGENGAGRNAWARNLYRRLSEYVHARGTNAGLWESTGPIYSANGFSLANHFFLETHALGVLLVKTAEQSVLIGDAARHLLSDQNLGSYLEAAHQRVCAFYVEQVLD